MISAANLESRGLTSSQTNEENLKQRERFNIQVISAGNPRSCDCAASQLTSEGSDGSVTDLVEAQLRLVQTPLDTFA